MKNLFRYIKGRSYRIRLVVFLVALLFVTGARGDEIIENQVEDINILIPQIIGGEPNVFIIWDNSLSMADNFGGSQVGNWDSDDVIESCETFQNVNTNYAKAHCIGNASGTNPCGSIACTGSQIGPCERPEDFENFLQCIETKYPTLFSSVYTTVVPNACGGSTPNPRTQCTNITERVHAAAAIEYEALKRANAANSANFPLNCGAANCTGDTDKSCNGSTEYNTFKTCMDSLRRQPTTTTCTVGQNCGRGKFGSTRMDISLSVFFELLDADDSLATKFCDDPNRFFDGVNTSISCGDFMNTPFRDVNGRVSGTTSLPITGATDTPLIDELTVNDADVLGLRFRPMTYSNCTSFQLSSLGFGSTETHLESVWEFFRGRTASGRTPLALSLGFDDNNTSGTDALGAYRNELQADPAISCRPEFVIVITDGEDTCSGDCNALPGSCSSTPAITGNANRRSSVQAVSNLRTFYSRNPVQGNVKKEIFTFVIGIGLNDPQSRRTLNAMALAGGTHTTGVIQHDGPDGITIGSVNINDVLPSGSAFQVFDDLGIAKGIDTSPSNAQLQGCKTRNENGVCTFQSTNIFDNNFFNTGAPFDSTSPFEDSNFAFFASNPEELTDALQNALQIIQEFSTTIPGVSPTAPTSSASVAIGDRILLANLTPNTTERLWQGRLALYGFVDEPGNPGSKVVIRKPDDGADLTSATVVDAHAIFDDNGVLNTTNATKFFWDASKNLVERDIRDIVGDPRRLFTIDSSDTNFIDVETSGTEVLSVRYEGERINFNLSSTLLGLDDFGISDADVSDPIPTFCTAGGIQDCSTDCTTPPFTVDCNTCVKGCIRDKIIDFMVGNTDIVPLGDPLGTPSQGAQPTLNSFGFNCPDLEAVPPTGSFDNCSVRLGDIFHSTPVLVGSPSPLFFDSGFHSFARVFSDRSAAVYVGANDGFLHSFHAGELEPASSSTPIENPFTLQDETVPFFNAGNGKELFGFAPPSFLPDSISLNDPGSPSGFTPDFRFGDFKTFIVEENSQRSFFDGSPLVADVFIDGYSNGISEDANICPGAISSPDGKIDLCGREWHTVLISGYRNGGGAYTALDVTNVDRTQAELKKFSTGPDYPEHLWTLFDKDFGNTWSDVTIGRVRMGTTDSNNVDITVDRWVMFVGGGLDPVDTDPTNGVTFGNAFYAIDIPTGKIIFKFHPTDPIPSTLSDSDLTEMTCDMVGRIGVFDINADGYMDLAYGGDDCGRLWRFDISLPIVDNDGDLSQTGLKGDADITAPNWTGDIAFCATEDINQCLDPTTIPVDPTTGISQRMPIFFAPTAVLDDLGQRHVIFVTGNRRNPSDTNQFGKLYNFIDNFIPAFLAGGTAVTASTKIESDFNAGRIIDLVPLVGVADQFTTEGGSTINNQGEFIVRFPSNVNASSDPNVESPTGEKGFGAPIVIRGVLLFTTFAPDPTADSPCESGIGEGRVFALDYLTGEPSLARVPGTSNLLSGSDTQKEATAGKTVAEGMPTPAQLTFGARGSVIMTVAFSGSATAGGANFLVMELPQIPTRTQTLFWEELL